MPGETDMSDLPSLPGSNQSLQSSPGSGDPLKIAFSRVMNLIQVYVISSQGGETFVNGLAHALCTPFLRFRGQNHLMSVGVRLDGTPNLVLAIAVGLRGVDDVDPGIEGSM